MKNSNLVYGVLFAILGFFCMVYPVISTLWVELMVGFGMIAGTVLALIRFPKQPGFGGKIFHLALAVLYALAGVFIIANPVQGATVLMIALGFIFIFEGIFIFVWLGNMKDSSGFMKGMTVLNGVVTLILGALVLMNLEAGMWFVGTLVGIDLIFTGLTMAFTPNAPIGVA